MESEDEVQDSGRGSIQINISGVNAVDIPSNEVIEGEFES